MPHHAIGIVAHERRREQALDIAHHTQADIINIQAGEPSTYAADANHIHVWTHLTKLDTQWSIVLEDDAQPVDDFHNQLTAALNAAPTPIVSLYLGKAFPTWWQPHIATAFEKAQANQACYIRSTHLLHAVGVAIRTEFVPKITQSNMNAKPIDEHITTVAQQHLPQPAISYTFPSLVDHEDADSVINHHNDSVPRTPGTRRAWHTGQRESWQSTHIDMCPL